MNDAYYPVDDLGEYSDVFDYSIWTPNTEVLLTNVRWDSSYRDVVYFPNNFAIDEYLENSPNRKINLTRLTYAAFNQPVRIDLPFNEVNRFNYIRVMNMAHPLKSDTRRTFYYFITDVVYVAPSTTQVNVQLDVFTTFVSGGNVKLGNIFVERGHVGIANSNNYLPGYRRDYLTEPEGFDLGSDLVIAEAYQHELSAPTWNKPITDDLNVVIYSTTCLHDYFTDTSYNPKVTVATGSTAQGLPNGMNGYIVDSVASFRQITQLLSRFPWISQGIASITLFPKITDGSIGIRKKWDSARGGFAVDVEPGEEVAGWESITVIRDSVDPVKLIDNFAPNFRKQREDPFSHLIKFETYPFMAVELTTYNGTPIILKPELVNGENIKLAIYTHFVVPSPRILVGPWNYNMIVETPTAYDRHKSEFLDFCTGIYNFPQFSIPNNSYLSYMASNRNSISYAHDSADWSQQRAMLGAQNSYNTATWAMNNATDQQSIAARGASRSTGITNEQEWNSLGINSVQGIGTGLIGGAAIGGVAGAAVGGLKGLADAGFNYARTDSSTSARLAQTANSNLTSQLSTSRSNALAGQVRDANRELATSVAKGDYANTIAGINAKVQDAKMLQPSISGQVGGEAFNLTIDGYRVVAKVKTISLGQRKKIGLFWCRYGYAINRYMRMPSNFQVMDKFTYWKLQDSYVTSGDCPETFKETVRGIFEKGVTVWANPLDIGNVDVTTNKPIIKVYYA